MVGARPKVILTPEERWEVKSLVELPAVSGLGEVGLDHTTSPDLWHRQERQLEDLVTGLEPSKVLTLHLRWMSSDTTDVEAFMRCLDILSPISPGSRRVQLHCFTGSKEVVEEWLESFPYTYFRFTKMVSRFTTRGGPFAPFPGIDFFWRQMLHTLQLELGPRHLHHGTIQPQSV